MDVGWRHRESNKQDQEAEVELDMCIREGFLKGDEELPDHSRHLVDCDLDEVLNFPMSRKKVWFNSIEAARGRVSMTFNKEKDAEDDIRHTDCEPNWEDMRKWIATGWK